MSVYSTKRGRRVGPEPFAAAVGCTNRATPPRDTVTSEGHETETGRPNTNPKLTRGMLSAGEAPAQLQLCTHCKKTPTKASVAELALRRETGKLGKKPVICNCNRAACVPRNAPFS